jgi:hypothetical protein
MKMKNTKTVLTAISAALMFSLTAGAFAQKTGLVNVDIRPIAKDIAMAINVNASRIPAAVQVKAPVAVDVCKVPEDRLAQQEKRGSASCEAKMTSPELERIVERELKGITHPK